MTKNKNTKNWKNRIRTLGQFGLRLRFHANAFWAFFFLIQCLVHCSQDMNSVIRHMNSNFLIIFSFQQNKWYLNAHKEDEESINYQTRETKKNEV